MIPQMSGQSYTTISVKTERHSWRNPMHVPGKKKKNAWAKNRRELPYSGKDYQQGQCCCHIRRLSGFSEIGGRPGYRLSSPITSTVQEITASAPTEANKYKSLIGEDPKPSQSQITWSSVSDNRSLEKATIVNRWRHHGCRNPKSNTETLILEDGQRTWTDVSTMNCLRSVWRFNAHDQEVQEIVPVPSAIRTIQIRTPPRAGEMRRVQTQECAWIPSTQAKARCGGVCL